MEEERLELELELELELLDLWKKRGSKTQSITRYGLNSNPNTDPNPNWRPRRV